MNREKFVVCYRSFSKLNTKDSSVRDRRSSTKTAKRYSFITDEQWIFNSFVPLFIDFMSKNRYPEKREEQSADRKPFGFPFGDFCNVLAASCSCCYQILSNGSTSIAWSHQRQTQRRFPSRVHRTWIRSHIQKNLVAIHSRLLYNPYLCHCNAVATACSFMQRRISLIVHHVYRATMDIFEKINTSDAFATARCG